MDTKIGIGTKPGWTLLTITAAATALIALGCASGTHPEVTPYDIPDVSTCAGALECIDTNCGANVHCDYCRARFDAGHVAEAAEAWAACELGWGSCERRMDACYAE
ncbi:MAG: hypothetical protein B7733_05785 [Myxococcales bacterium FL481]|nr:MAG: hypothetical protein B7733_05785 [Myxococcales bacterium FL481]